jgi:hypothetical protein
MRRSLCGAILIPILFAVAPAGAQTREQVIAEYRQLHAGYVTRSGPAESRAGVTRADKVRECVRQRMGSKRKTKG